MIQIHDKSLNYMDNCGKIGTEQSGVSAPLMPLTKDLHRRQSMASDDCIIAPAPGIKKPRGYSLTKVTVGEKFHRLTVVSGPFKGRRNRTVFRCACDCGQMRDVPPASLITGKYRSCGCLKSDTARKRAVDRNYRHGEGKGNDRSPEYVAWYSMKQRCNNPAHAAYAGYGGRGITIYPDWNESFQDFLRDVGRRPTPHHSIDRIDNNRGYEPGNVRWATRVEQCANRRSTVLITINGETRIISEWVRHFKVDSRRLNRLLRRMSPEDVAAVLSK